MATTANLPNPDLDSAARGSASASRRLLSLDVLRGLTIAFMIMVNNNGGSGAWKEMHHAAWNGFTATDLVFPTFLFVVGVSLVFSTEARLRRGAAPRHLAWHMLTRAVVLFVFGIVVNNFPYFHWVHMRFYGVLQRIAICYVITSILALWTGKRIWITTAVACLVGYWILMRYVPVPGFGVPTHDIPLLDPDRNLAAWLDRKLLAGHLYEGTRDPEGVISTIPAVATSLLGLLTGDWLRSARSPRSKVLGMLSLGILGVIAGETFNLWFPINKKLWTSSFVLLTVGLALLCLAASYWIVDARKWRGRWTTFFLVFGMNAIAAYGFSELISHCLDRFSAAGGLTWQEWLYQHGFAPLASPVNASLLYGISYVLMCWLAMWVLYRKGIFLKI